MAADAFLTVTVVSAAVLQGLVALLPAEGQVLFPVQVARERSELKTVQELCQLERAVAMYNFI